MGLRRRPASPAPGRVDLGVRRVRRFGSIAEDLESPVHTPCSQQLARLTGFCGPGDLTSLLGGGSVRSPDHPPQGLILGGQIGAPNGAKKCRFFTPCGAKPRGGGGAPPTTLILLRNQRPPSVPSRAPHEGPRQHLPAAPRGASRPAPSQLAARLCSAHLLASPTATASPRPSRGVSGGSGLAGARPPTHDAPCGAGLAFHSATSRSALQSGGGSLRSVSGSRTAACLWPGPSRTQGVSRPTAKGNTKLPRQGAFPRPGVLDLVPPDRLQA